MKYLFASLVLVLSSICTAEDVIRINIGESLLDGRAVFKRELLEGALKATKNQYGTYKIIQRQNYMNAKRAFKELARGGSINVYYALTNPKWEELAIPIRVPVRCGMVSYRLLIIERENREKFANLTSIEELKSLRVGLDDGWTTYSILKDQGFNVVNVGNYDNMFYMLSAGRFDYLIRGVNEIYEEVESRQDDFANLMVEPSLAMYLPAATYIFVSKHTPKLAERIREGLTTMQYDGSLAQICEKYFAQDLKKADFSNRKIFEVHPQFPPHKSDMQAFEQWMKLYM